MQRDKENGMEDKKILIVRNIQKINQKSKYAYKVKQNPVNFNKKPRRWRENEIALLKVI